MTFEMVQILAICHYATSAIRRIRKRPYCIIDKQFFSGKINCLGDNINTFGFGLEKNNWKNKVHKYSLMSF